MKIFMKIDCKLNSSCIKLSKPIKKKEIILDFLLKKERYLIYQMLQKEFRISMQPLFVVGLIGLLFKGILVDSSKGPTQRWCCFITVCALLSLCRFVRTLLFIVVSHGEKECDRPSGIGEIFHTVRFLKFRGMQFDIVYQNGVPWQQGARSNKYFRKLYLSVRRTVRTKEGRRHFRTRHTLQVNVFAK